MSSSKTTESKAGLLKHTGHKKDSVCLSMDFIVHVGKREMD